MTDVDIVERLREAMESNGDDPIVSSALLEIDRLRAEVKELNQVLSENNCPKKYVQQGGYTRCLYGTSSISAYETLQAENESLRKVLDAADNLIKVKGRYHSEQAYGRLVTAVAGMKGKE